MARRSALNNILPLLDRLEPQVAGAFVAAIFAAREGLDVRALQSALEAGDLARAVDLLAMPQGLLFPLDNALANAFATGGALVTESARKAGVVFGFDGRHPQAEAWARQHIGGLITGIADESREAVTVAVRDVLERQLVAGIGPRNAALDLVGRVDKATGRRVGGIVGLDGPRAERLRIVGDAMRTPEGVRSLVQGGKVKYKVNRATEARILRAYNAGEAVSKRDRVLSLKQYGNQLLQQRGETISRTETITALRQGRREGFKQAVDQGKVDPDAITREWDATLDKRTREDHAAMDGKKIDGLDDAWVLPDGSRMMTPGDSSLGASAGQIINCRCYENIRVDWLRKSSDGADVATAPPEPKPTREQIASASAQRLRARGSTTGHEHFEIISRDGVVQLQGTSGHARKIEFSQSEISAMSERGAKLALHHNHPADITSFSPADVWAFSRLPGVSEMYAHADRASFYMAQSAKTTKLTRKIIENAQKDAQRALARAVNAGANVGQVLNLEPHAMMQILSRRGYISYTASFPDDVLQLVGLVDGNI